MGHKFSDDMRAEHMVDAFKNEVGNRKLDTSVIHHSDRGLQYCSEEFQNVAGLLKMGPSEQNEWDSPMSQKAVTICK